MDIPVHAVVPILICFDVTLEMDGKNDSKASKMIGCSLLCEPSRGEQCGIDGQGRCPPVGQEIHFR